MGGQFNRADFHTNDTRSSQQLQLAFAADPARIEQALQIVGGRTLHSKVIAPDNRIGKLLKSDADDATLVDQLFLATLSRHPDAAESTLAVSAIADHAQDRRRAAEDLFWTLLNHPEFLFQH